MDKRYFNRKVFAFTLAEMLVILAVFSVIAAATLPVITAHQKLGNSDNATTGDFAGVDKWTYSNLGLSNIKAGTYSTVAIGMEPTSSDVPIGVQPQLMINKIGNVQDTSHIAFLGTANSNVYFNGRLSMAGENVAIGNDALWFGGSDRTQGSYKSVYSNNIAIGTKSMYRNDSSYNSSDEVSLDGEVIGTYLLKSSIAIGNRAMLSSGAAYSIAIGNDAFSNKGGLYSIAIGKYSGYGYNMSASCFEWGEIYIGNYASYKLYGMGSGFCLIGGYSGMYASSSTPIGTLFGKSAIGYYSSVSSDDLTAVGIGYYSALMQDEGRGIYIGSYAGRNSTHDFYLGHDNESFSVGYNSGGLQSSYYFDEDITNIGYYSGYSQSSYGDFNRYSPTNVGAYSGYRQYGVSLPINIGYAAGMNQRSTTKSTGAINIGYKAGYAQTTFTSPINIGYYAGGHATKADYTICIGPYACAYDAGEYDIRIGMHNDIKLNKYWYSSINALKNYYAGSFSSSDTVSRMVQRRSYIGYSPNHEIIEKGNMNCNITQAAGSGSPCSANSYSSRPWAPNTTGTPSLRSSTIYSYAKNYAQLLITGGTAPNKFSTSSILLYSTHIYGPATFFRVYSDKRLKENIKPSKYSLKDLRKINIYEYNFKDDKTKTPRIGVIAQELQKIIPQAVTKNNEGYLAINAEWINYTVINSIKELANQVEIIQKEFTSYVKEFVMLAKKVNTLEKQIKNLEQENKVLLTSVDKAYRKAKAKK
ncbi:MAG: tail fiber domain-containing protein [Candidatus Gastranaerophilaceae bacterium]